MRTTLTVAFASDHAGFPLREVILAAIRDAGCDLRDLGAPTLQPGDDYPDIVAPVARAVAAGEVDRAVLVCGSGVGASVAANKFAGVRAALCHDSFSAHQGVEDDDMNILCLGARVIGPSMAAELVRDFLGARFSGLERHVRRLQKVRAFEGRAQDSAR